jgi:phage-related protein
MDGITKLFGTDPDSGIEMISSGLEQFVDKLLTALPKVIELGKKLVLNLLKAVEKNLPMLMKAAVEIVMELVNDIVAELPTLIMVAIDLLMMLVQGITDNLPVLIPALVDAILFIVEKLTEPEMLIQLIDAALQLMIALADGLLKALPKLIEAIPVIIFNIISTLVQYFPQIVSKVGELLSTIGKGLGESALSWIKAIGDFWSNVGKTIGGWFNSVKNWGKDLIDNFVNGIKEKIGQVKETVSNIAETIKNLLGFSEPEEGPLSDFHTYAPDMMKLFAKGIRDNKGLLEDEFDEALNFAVNADVPGGKVKALTTPEQSTGNPVTIIVQSVLDGRIIGETAYKYSREKARAYGL